MKTKKTTQISKIEGSGYGYVFWTIGMLFTGLVFGSLLYLIYRLISRKWNNKIYIISNWDFNQQYENIQHKYPGTYDAFKRRINFVGNLKEVKEFEEAQEFF